MLTLALRLTGSGFIGRDLLPPKLNLNGKGIFALHSIDFDSICFQWEVRLQICPRRIRCCPLRTQGRGAVNGTQIARDMLSSL